MHRILMLLVSVVGVALGASAGAAAAASYEVVPGEPNLVRFESKAPLESFDGKTREVKGTLDFNPENLADSVRMIVEVDAKSLDTGIPLRNRHMRENHLETGQHPAIVFRIHRLVEASRPSLSIGETVSVTAVGEFELHGVTREIRVPVKVTRTDEPVPGALRIEAQFQVRLPDHAIARPQFLALKLDEVQRISVTLLARPRPRASIESSPASRSTE